MPKDTRFGGMAGGGTRSAAASGAWEKQEHGKDNHGRRGGGDDDQRSFSFTAASRRGHIKRPVAQPTGPYLNDAAIS